MLLPEQQPQVVGILQFHDILLEGRGMCQFPVAVVTRSTNLGV